MKFIHIIFAGFVIVFFGACTKNFEEINTNPNEAPTTDANYVFNFVIKEAAGEYGFVGSYNRTYMSRWCMQTSAVWGNSTMPPYSLFDQYRIQNLWEYYYSVLLSNCRVLENLTSENSEDVNKYQVARIWKIYSFHRVTDIWGDVPYSEAWEIIDGYNSESLKPAYDSQKDIYSSMINELGDAVSKFEDGKPFYTDDMIFNGNIENWIKFANSLRLRLAVRSGNQEVVNELVTENNFISNNDESAMFSYIESQDWWNPYYELGLNSETSVPKISDLMMLHLASLNDPRMEIYAEPNEVFGTYIGVPNLLDAFKDEPQALGMGVTTTSYIGTYFTENKEYSNPLLSYSEVCFLRAEAALRGWSGDDPQLMYENGVRASMEYYEIEPDSITEYINNRWPYNATIEQVIVQKWISLYLNGWEAFAEYRRTGYPQLRKYDLELNGLIITSKVLVEVPRNYVPGRLPYPDSEYDLNQENYHDAVSKLENGDTYNQQVWWAKEFGTVDY